MSKVNRPWIDALRALAIFLVMVGHASYGVSPYFAWTSPVKIPLFFAISGFLFHGDGYDGFASFLMAKAKRLLVPYAALGALNSLCMILGRWLLLHQPLGGLLHDLAGDFLSGTILWFIPCLFIAEIILYLIHYLAAKGFQQPHVWWIHVLLTLLSIALALPGVIRGSTLPWHVDTALLMIVFAEFGYLLRSMEERLLHIPLWLGALFLAGYLLSCQTQILLGCQGINAGGNRWPCLPLNLLTCLTGILALFALFPKFPIPSCIQWMGKNTLTYYAFHNIIQMGIAYCAALLFTLPDPENCLWMGIAVALAACVLCAVPSFLINRFCPVIAGSHRSAVSGKEHL